LVKSVLAIDFITAHHTTVAEARSEFDKAYGLARQTYRNENLKFSDRVFSFKIILFCLKMLHDSWESLWEHEIQNYFAIAIIVKAMKKRSGQEFDATVELMSLIKQIIGYEHCSKIAELIKQNFQQNTDYLQKFLKDSKHQAHVELMQIYQSDTALHIAARQPNAKVLQQAIKEELKRSKTVDVTNEYGCTPLMLAANYGHTENLRLLIKAGGNIKLQPKDGYPALHRAAVEGHPNCISMLIEQGADIDAQDTKFGCTPLQRAVIKKKIDCVKLLIQCKANLSSQDQAGETALHDAASGGNIEAMKLLLAAGANVKMVDNEGMTPLHKAAQSGNVDCIKLLLKAKSMVDQLSNHCTAVCYAANEGHLEAVKLLIAAGANINIINTNDAHFSPPLFAACYNGHIACVICLLQHGAKITHKVSFEGNIIEVSAMHAASMGGKSGIIKILAEYGARVDLPGESHMTPLHYVTLHSDSTECVELLITMGASVDARMDNDKTPLHTAAQKENMDIVRVLLEKGADPNALDGNGNTPLMFAAKNGNYECLKMILKAGGKPNIKGSCEITALHAACLGGCHIDCMRELLKNGAQVNALSHHINGKACTPLDTVGEEVNLSGDVKSLSKSLLRSFGGLTREELSEISPNVAK
jgi:ankyrin repeat protein